MIGLVAGFGRCGSSLVMAMLRAGGLPVFGHPPIFESTEFNEHITSETFLRRKAGFILKWLDPTHTYLPPEFRGGPVLWLDRDPSDWAESHMKLRHMWTGSPMRHDDQETHAALTSEVVQRTASVTRKLESYGPIERLRFEYILSRPSEAAGTLARVFHAFGVLDVSKAAALVHPRPPQCAVGMEFDQAAVLNCIRRTS